MFERRYIFQTIIFGIYVSFRGCISIPKYWKRILCFDPRNLQRSDPLNQPRKNLSISTCGKGSVGDSVPYPKFPRKPPTSSPPPYEGTFWVYLLKNSRFFHVFQRCKAVDSLRLSCEAGDAQRWSRIAFWSCLLPRKKDQCWKEFDTLWGMLDL